MYCEVCCEASSVVCEWEGTFFGLVYPECGWVSLWDCDLSGLFCAFGTWFFGQDSRYGHVDGRDA